MGLLRRFVHTATNNLPKMRVVQFKYRDDLVRIGLLDGESVIDVNAGDRSIPNSLVELLHHEDGLERMKKVAANPKQVHQLSQVKLVAPIIKPDKILGVVANYKDDCNKRNIPYPKEPIIFSKFPSIITGPNDAISKPVNTNALDWEVELVVVIGKKAHLVKAENAMDFVFGYTVTQDLTAKDWAARSGGQLVMSKNFDSFCPLGPCVVTKEEMGDPHRVKLRTWVNGQLKQDGCAESMVHKVPQIIEYLTKVITLLPGDLICTGTPVGTGASQIPPQYLQKGDLLESEVEGIGRMSNRII